MHILYHQHLSFKLFDIIFNVNEIKLHKIRQLKNKLGVGNLLHNNHTQWLPRDYCIILYMIYNDVNVECANNCCYKPL